MGLPSFQEDISKDVFISFLVGTMEDIEEKKKKVSVVPATLKKEQKNFIELKIKCPGKKSPKCCFERQGGSLSIRKLSPITRNTGSFKN